VEEDFLPITYKIDISKKNPVWRDDLKTLAGAFIPQGGLTSLELEFTEEQALLGKRLDMEIDYPTSDITITGIRGTAAEGQTTTKVIATKKYDNEKNYWVDFGFVIPLKSVKELQFNSDGKLVQPKPVEKNNIFGTVGLFPFGSVNTKGDNLLRLSPQIIYGMALDKNPWNHQLFALGLGLKWVQPFAGVVGTRSAIAGADDKIAGYKWNWKFTYGIQIPISKLTDFVKKTGGN